MKTRIRLLLRSLVVAAVAAAGIGVGLQAPASADIGDGSLQCNVGEICFERYHPSSYQNLGGLKHFWNASLTHSSYNFGGVGGFGTGDAFMDHTGGFWNRDTVCNVWMEDIDGQGHCYPYLILNQGAAPTETTVKTAV